MGPAGCEGREGEDTQLDCAGVGEALERGGLHQSAAKKEHEGDVKRELLSLKD
jgi:hypothetical protein